MVREQRLAEVFVELADTLVEEFDVVDLLQTLTERCVELIDTDAAGLMLDDQRGNLRLIAHTHESARLLELFELQQQEGPCLDCFATGPALAHIAPGPARAGGAPARAAGGPVRGLLRHRPGPRQHRPRRRHGAVAVLHPGRPRRRVRHLSRGAPAAAAGGGWGLETD